MAELGKIQIKVEEVPTDIKHDTDVVGVFCYPDHDEFSRHPGRVRLMFRDGSTAIYDLNVEQPAPVIIENIKIIRRMKQGYVNQPMRRRNRK